MTNIEKLSAWHRAQIGTREQGNNRVRYNDSYYGKPVSGEGFPWCAAYIWCGFKETGLSALFLDGGKSAYCPYIMDWAKQHGRWVTGEYREGDLLLYDWGADGVADHIGYCLSWDGVTATAIEGNAADQVMTVRRHKGQILGAYRPDYGGGTNGKSTSAGVTAGTGNVCDSERRQWKAFPTLKKGMTGEAVKAWQYMLLAMGGKLSMYGADGDFGTETETETKSLQKYLGTAPDGVVGCDTMSRVMKR